MFYNAYMKQSKCSARSAPLTSVWRLDHCLHESMQHGGLLRISRQTLRKHYHGFFVAF